MIEALLLRGDHIIRGADYRGEIANSLQIVTKTAKGLHIGHEVALREMG